MRMKITPLNPQMTPRRVKKSKSTSVNPTAFASDENKENSS